MLLFKQFTFLLLAFSGLSSIQAANCHRYYCGRDCFFLYASSAQCESCVGNFPSTEMSCPPGVGDYQHPDFCARQYTGAPNVYCFDKEIPNSEDGLAPLNNG